MNKGLNDEDALRRQLMEHALECCPPPEGFCQKLKQCDWRNVTEGWIDNIASNYSDYRGVSWAEFRKEVRKLRKALNDAADSLEKIFGALALIIYSMEPVHRRNVDYDKKRHRLYRIQIWLWRRQSKFLEKCSDSIDSIKVKGGRMRASEILKKELFGVSVESLKYKLVSECFDVFIMQSCKLPTTSESGEFVGFCNAVYDLAKGEELAHEGSSLERAIKEVIRDRHDLRCDDIERLKVHSAYLVGRKCLCGTQPLKDE